MGRALILLACSTCAFALNPEFDVHQYAHKSWTVREGFFKGAIQTIAQTPDGYLWLGTEFGLLRFDGVKADAWQPPPDQPLPSNAIMSLLTTRDGTLWIGTYKGLVSWKGGKLTQYPELAGRIITALLEDREGSVWAGGSGIVRAGRLCAIQKDRVQCYGEDGSFGSGVFSLYELRGSLWVGAAAGLWRWKPDPPKLYPMQGPSRGMSALIEGDNGALWIARLGGIRQLVNGKDEAYPLPAGGQFKPYRLLRDHEGSLWIGTSTQGLLHVHPGRTDVFVQADGLSGNHVLSLFEDREGNIWIGTEDGLDRFRDFAVPTISLNLGLSDAAVYSVLAAKDGSVWLATSDGLAQRKGGQITIYRKRGRLRTGAAQPPAREIFDDGLPDNPMESLFEDDRGRIWVSTLRGIAWFEDGRFTPVRSMPSRVVRSIAEESPGNLWISDQDYGLYRLVDGRVAELVPWAKLGHEDFASVLLPDRVRGGLWLGFFQGGVAYFKDDKIRASYAAASGLGEGTVYDLRLDPDGTIWAATEGGLSRLKDGRITTLTSKSGLPCDAVYGVMEDDAHSFWLSMSCGLARIARSELDAWAANPNRTIQAAVFDSSDGIRSRATGTSGYTPQVAKSLDGRLWFPSVDGVSVVDPRHLPFNKLPPPVHIEQIIADRKTYGVDAKLSLPPLTRDLEIDYTALSLVAPEKIRFRYKLEGRDRDWQDAGNRRQAFYSDLSPHNYRFRVMASNNSGVWNEAGASFDFSVAPKYYQTGWFQASCGIAFLAVLWGLYQLRVKQVEQQLSIRLEERVNERTRIARDLHDTLLQSFQGVLLKFHAVTFMLPNRAAEAQTALAIVIEQARKAIAEGRDAVQGLRASGVVTNDLAGVIGTLRDELAADEFGQNRPDFRVNVEGTPRNLVPIVRDEAYRIACEAVRNAFRHAQAGRIEVDIYYDQRKLRLRVRDDGKGIDPKVLAEGRRDGHHGLPGMHERARLVGGKLAVWSELDSGTEAELTIPASIAYTKGA